MIFWIPHFQGEVSNMWNMFQTGSTIPFHQVCVERSLTTLQIIGGTEAQQEPGNPGLNVEEPEAIQVI